MSSRQSIANFLEQHRDDLLTALVVHIPPDMETTPQSLATGWLDNHIAFFRGKPCRMGEWAAQFVEASRKTNTAAGEAYQYVKRLRKTLIERCLGNIPKMPDADVISELTESTAHFEQAVVEYFSQRVYEDSVANQRRQKAILESVEQPMAIINAEGIIDTANRALCRLLKTNQDAFSGLDFLSLCDEATAARFRTFLRQKRAEQSKSSFPAVFKFGTTKVEAQLSCQPFFSVDGLRVGAAIFIDSDGKSEADMDTGIRYLEERLLPLAPFALQVFDSERRITYNSESVAQLGLEGYTGQEPVCCFLSRHRHGEQRPCPCLHLLGSSQFHMEEISNDTLSGMRWFMLLFLPLPDNAGNAVRMAVCAYDLTRRKQSQKQLEGHIIKQQRSSLVAQLSIAVAHQLRNPLSVVLGFAEMMAKGLAPDQYAEAVSRILRNSLRCKDIVENLLDFGKGMPLERRPLDFETLMRESVRTQLTPAQNRIIEWRFSGKPAPIECVPEQVAQVVLSLLDNALRMAHNQIVCTVENKGDLIRLRVVDDGPGIELDLRDRIFEPFFTTRREEGATGLGLSLARAVATDYGGSLTVSAPGGNEPRGACLVLQLPLMKPVTETKDKEDAPKAEISERKILIVDDEADLQDLLKTTLYMRGYLADTVGTGMEALEKLKETEYDAIVLDYLLKGALSGQQVYREIGSQYPHLVSRVLFITADMLNYQTRLFVESTGRPVLEKPFLIADFMAELAKLM